MDQIKIGKFIAESRKLKNMTQADLAEKLGVSNRSVSRWENGRNMPDLSLFSPLCEALGITTSELINGEQSDEQITEEEINTYKKFLKRRAIRKKLRIALGVIVIIFGVILALLLSFNKTFFKTTYQSEFSENVRIQIPKYSYYRGTGGMDIHYVKLKTLREHDDVELFIDKYLLTLERVEYDGEVYYYNENRDFTIFMYHYTNDGRGPINTIYIGYFDGEPKDRP